MRRLTLFAIVTVAEWILIFAVMHELLRQFMTHRNVVPWRASDSLANGFFLFAGCALAVAGANSMIATAHRGATRGVIIGAVLFVLGAAIAFGGALSLRKLY